MISTRATYASCLSQPKTAELARGVAAEIGTSEGLVMWSGGVLKASVAGLVIVVAATASQAQTYGVKRDPVEKAYSDCLGAALRPLTKVAQQVGPRKVFNMARTTCS